MFDLNPNLNRKRKRKKPLIIIATTALVAGVIVGSFFGYRWWKDRQVVKYAAAQTPNSQTSEGNASGADESASNTYQQNRALQASVTPNSVTKVVLPTPLLMKSSGNNGPVPPGVDIEFTCASQAGYTCKVVMTGAHTKTFDAKDLKDNGRGQASVSWIWTSEVGQHSLKAILSDGKGNEQDSSAQTLEVKS